MANDDRIRHLIRFYSILDVLEKYIGGARKLAECSGRIMWPRRGVYFFRETGEHRSDSGAGERVHGSCGLGLMRCGKVAVPAYGLGCRNIKVRRVPAKAIIGGQYSD